MMRKDKARVRAMGIKRRGEGRETEGRTQVRD